MRGWLVRHTALRRLHQMFTDDRSMPRFQWTLAHMYGATTIAAHFDAAPGLMPSSLPMTKPGAKPMVAAPGASRNSAPGHAALSMDPVRVEPNDLECGRRGTHLACPLQ